MPELHYSNGDPAGALAFFRDHRVEMRALRLVRVEPEGTTVKDIKRRDHSTWRDLRWATRNWRPSSGWPGCPTTRPPCATRPGQR